VPWMADNPQHSHLNRLPRGPCSLSRAWGAEGPSGPPPPPAWKRSSGQSARGLAARERGDPAPGRQDRARDGPPRRLAGHADAAEAPRCVRSRRFRAGARARRPRGAKETAESHARAFGERAHAERSRADAEPSESDAPARKCAARQAPRLRRRSGSAFSQVDLGADRQSSRSSRVASQARPAPGRLAPNSGTACRACERGVGEKSARSGRSVSTRSRNAPPPPARSAARADLSRCHDSPSVQAITRSRRRERVRDAEPRARSRTRTRAPAPGRRTLERAGRRRRCGRRRAGTRPPARRTRPHGQERR